MILIFYSNCDEHPNNEQNSGAKLTTKQVQSLLSKRISNINNQDIKYLGHGIDSDGYAITMNKIVYVFKFFRREQGYQKNRFETFYLPKLVTKLKSINAQITIPDINFKLSNIGDYSVSSDNYLGKYVVYPMIQGKQLNKYTLHEEIKIFNQQFNIDQLSKLLQCVHTYGMEIYNTHKNNKNDSKLGKLGNNNIPQLSTFTTFEVVKFVFENKVKTIVSKPYYNDLFKSEKLRNFMQSNVIEKCEKIILPLYESLQLNKNNNELDKIFNISFSHCELRNVCNFCIDEKTLHINGIMDWADMRRMDLVFDFQEIWSLDKQLCYKYIKKYEFYQGKQFAPFFYARLDIFGFLRTISKLGPIFGNNDRDTDFTTRRLHYLKRVIEEMEGWDKMVEQFELTGKVHL